MARVDTCVLCGRLADDVVIALVDWADEAKPFDSLPRCRSRQDCRARLEATGERWPLRDRTTPTTTPTATPPAVATPELEAAEEEAPSWL